MADALLSTQVGTGKCILNFTINTEKLGEDQLTLDVVQTRLLLLEKYWTETLQRHMKLLTYETEKIDEDYFVEDRFTEYETAYTLAKSQLRARIAAFVETAQAEYLPTQDRGAQFQVQTTATSLPKLKLPTFAGKQEEWDTSKEIFSSMIKDNTALTPVLKLQHLVSCVEGEAARRLANFEVIGSNFDVAWAALCRRYDSKRLRQAVQIFKLLNMAPITHRSPNGFTRLLDTTSQYVQAFQQLRRPIDQWDDWFVHLIVHKLDQQTREDWEKSLEGSEDYPTHQKLSFFLENRVKALDNVHCNVPEKAPPKPKPAGREKPRSVATHHTQADTSNAATSAAPPAPAKEMRDKDPCTVCQGAHFIVHCPVYLHSTANQKKGTVDKLKLCRNCLRAHHLAPSCSSKYRCRLCQEPHQSTLHEAPAGVFMPAGPRPHLASINDHSPPGRRTYVTCTNRPVLLGTARVLLKSSTGLHHEARVLIDPASEAHFMTERMVQLLRLHRSLAQTAVKGVGSVIATSKSQVTASVRSKLNPKVVLSFSALVLPKLTALLPTERVNRCDWPHITGSELADPEFHLPAEVDGILGAGIYALIIEDGLRRGMLGTPVAQCTKLGWILTGERQSPADINNPCVNAFPITLQPATSIAEELRRFWEIEELTTLSPLTAEEQACEDHYRSTHQRDASGRYVLRLPFKREPGSSDNKGTAVSRMQQVERRLAKDADLRAQYHTFMTEYEQLGHLETIPQEQVADRLESTSRIMG